MARKKSRSTATRRRATVKQHKIVHKDNMIEEKAQNQGVVQPIQQNPAVSPTVQPVAVSEIAQSVTQGYPQPQSLMQPPTVPTNSTPPPDSSQIPPAQPKVETTSNSQEFEPEKKSKLWIVLVVVFIVLTGVGGVLYYLRTGAVEKSTKEEKVTASPTKSLVSPTVSQATESANLKVDYLQYAIKVLNGGGIKGEAARVKDSLEEEKFVVEDIDNADTSDYEKTIIKAKKDVPKEYLDTLKKLLGKTYVLGSEEELEEVEDVDVIIIIGGGKKP